MWYLTSRNEKRVIYIAPINGKVTIGRSVDSEICDFSIPDDASISRRHATLAIQGEDLVVTDLGSKYGTFVNQLPDAKGGLAKDVTTIVHEDDIIRFGAINSVWKVKKINYVVCASTLKGENLQTLKSLITQLGGTFLSDWNEKCLYLTMPAITLTIKVVLALVQGAHIVTLEFWNKCIAAISTYSKQPDPKEFLPQIVESTLNKESVSFSPNIKRRKIFSGKQFVFLSRRQLEMYKNVLVMASATPVLLSESKMSKSMLSEPHVIVIQYILNNTTQESQVLQNQINGIVSYLKSKGKRVVADAEIGLAILYCSLDKYCNPFFNYSTEVMKETTGLQNTNKSTNILAPESQETTVNNKVKKEVCVDETLPGMNDNLMEETSTGLKRKLSEGNGDIVENAAKKIATEGNVNNDDDSQPFNFIEPTENKNNGGTSENSLDFLRPMKRKQDQMNVMDEDNLFNFITTKDKTEESVKSKNNIFGLDQIKEEPFEPPIKRTKVEETMESINFSALFGKTLKAMLESDKSWKSTNHIKKEEDITEELEAKIGQLDLGTTIVIIKDDLIVENKVPVNIDLQKSNGKNFKLFKKVWPIKMNASIIPKSSMNVIKLDSSAIEVSG